VVLTVDSVVGVRGLESHEMMSAEQLLPFAEYIQGVAKIEDNIVLINDLEQFLSIDEERMLDVALSTKTE
jgi:purine-binding chemotaxis protein CheW